MRVGREILHVAGDHGETVALSGGYDQTVHHRQGPAGQLRARPKEVPVGRRDLRPDVERRGIDRQDASGEALLHLAQASGEFLAAAPG